METLIKSNSASRNTPQQSTGWIFSAWGVNLLEPSFLRFYCIFFGEPTQKQFSFRCCSLGCPSCKNFSWFQQECCRAQGEDSHGQDPNLSCSAACEQRLGLAELQQGADKRCWKGCWAVVTLWLLAKLGIGLAMGRGWAGRGFHPQRTLRSCCYQNYFLPPCPRRL